MGTMTVQRSSAVAVTIVGLCTLVAFAVHHLVGDVSAMVAALVLGVAVRNTIGIPESAPDTIRTLGVRCLRVGIVLFGFQLAFDQMLDLGAPGVAVVVVTVTTTFVATRWLGRRLGVSPGLSLLVATGFSICGASAIAAMENVADADEEETAYALALVTLCGSAAILLLPALAAPLGLTDGRFGAWVGASVHDMAQVVATASTGGDRALEHALVVKLVRVLLLAPIVIAVSVASSRAGAGRAHPGRTRVAFVPPFVVGFLLTAGVRTSGVLPDGALDALKTTGTVVLVAALAAVGCGVQLAKLRRLGGRPLILALAAWSTIATISFVGLHIVAAA